MTFGHRSDGTSEEAWLDSARWTTVPALVLAELRRLVVVSAHPGDESLGASGLMARAANTGVPVHLVVATNGDATNGDATNGDATNSNASNGDATNSNASNGDATNGDASNPNSPTVTGVELAAIRQSELRAAVELSAPSATIDFLELPDGRLREHSAALKAHLESLGLAEGTLVLAPWRHDGNDDHEAAGNVAARAARASGAQLLEYPVWMWHWATPDDDRVPWGRIATLQLGEEERAAKAGAIAAHRSQNAPLFSAVDDEVLSDAFRDHFTRPFEVFVTPTGSPTLAREFFDRFYEGIEDPWGFETRWYEIRKRALTIASLPRPLFASGLEIGCSIGVLTAELAGRCARLVATDIAEQPLARARARLIEAAHVELVQVETPLELPGGMFDLVVLSEVAYYWSSADLERAIARIDAALADDGVVVACHWRHPVDGYPLCGDDVHAALRAHPGFALLSEHREEDFLLDVFVRTPAQSVARETGVI